MSCENLLGDDFNIFWDSADNWDTPTWVRILDATDIVFDPNRTQVEIRKRIRHKTYKKGMHDWELSFTLNYNPANEFCQQIRTCLYDDNTNIIVALADGDSMTDPAVTYWRAHWEVFGPLNANLDEPAEIEITLKVSCDTGDDDSELPEMVEGET